MARYLLDTNIALRYSNSIDPQHELILQAIETLLSQGHECCLTSQILVEFWLNFGLWQLVR